MSGAQGEIKRNSVNSLCHLLPFRCFHLSVEYIFLLIKLITLSSWISVVCRKALMLVRLNQYAVCLLSTWQIPVFIWSSYFRGRVGSSPASQWGGSDFKPRLGDRLSWPILVGSAVPQIMPWPLPSTCYHIHCSLSIRPFYGVTSWWYSWR